MNWFYIYILYSLKDKKLYTGFTNNLKRRLQEHNDGKVESTRKRTPLILIYSEACLNIQDALAREKYLKSGMGKKFIRNRLKAYIENL